MLLTVVFCILFYSVSSSQVPNSQIQGLQLLYNHTAGDNWVWNPSLPGIPWNFSNTADVCLWQGVNCTSNCSSEPVCNILDLNLYNHNLTGTIPSGINLIEHLQVLILSTNSIMSTLPFEFSSLSSLISLDLSYNFISGQLWSRILSFSNLSYLDVTNNMFKETLPNTINTISSLSYISIVSNEFYNTIPTTIGLLSLIYLDLYSNYLNGTIY